MNKLFRAASRLLFDRNGPLTRELLRSPAGFGLGQVPSRLEPDSTTTAVCGFCSTGCGLDIHLKDGKAVNLSPAKDYSVNLGMACPKGWEALTPLRAKDRGTRPLVKSSTGEMVPVSWEEAASTFVTRMKAIQAEHGRGSVAFLSTGQIPTEEMALLGLVARLGMGFLHGDSNTRQCMATSAVAYKQSFGFDAPPFSYTDFEESDVLVFVGANPCIAHPILWERVCQNRHAPEIIVVDPRRTETAMAATRHLALLPKSDLTLFYGLANLLIAGGYVDSAFVSAHTTGFEAFADHVKAFSVERVVRETGIERETLETVTRLIGEGKRVSFWWTMGVNQGHEAVRTAQALINLALITGNIGRPGTGANSITGQCNAMGSRLFANVTSLFGGHSFTSDADRAKIADIVGTDVDQIPKDDSLAYDQILDAIDTGEIRGLWIIATNTAHSWINQKEARRRLEKLDFLVVQDMFTSTESAKLAHLYLPAAGWGEKEGTFINSERRIGLLKKVSVAPGEALSDFLIFRLLASAWGGIEWAEKWTRPEDMFQAMKAASRGQPCDITGISGYAMLEEKRGIQWPLPEGADVPRRAQRRLFEDGRFFTPDGRARLLFEEPRPLPEPTSDEFPLTLLTGRGSSSQWHTNTRTGKSELLRKLYSEEPYVEIHPEDAKARGIEAFEWVVVLSARGEMRARARLTPIVRAGQVFVPMHYEGTNHLTFPAFDPYSRQPSYKAAAVQVKKDPPRGAAAS